MEEQAIPSTREEQMAALKQLDQESEALQKEGKLLEALQRMEKSLILRGHLFGLDSKEVLDACKTAAETCNYLAMSNLQAENFDLTMELLSKAEVLSEKHKAVRAVTYNNMGCCFRKKGRVRTALNYVKKALDIEAKLDNTARTADTHLNMCTILSELKRHDEAILHARTALKLLLMELFGPEGYATKQEEEEDDYESEDAPTVKLPPDRVAVLAIAYHNLAVQQVINTHV